MSITRPYVKVGYCENASQCVGAVIRALYKRPTCMMHRDDWVYYTCKVPL